MFLKSISFSRTANILAKFPQQFSFCFAYGSGIKQQLGYNNVAQQQTMLDMVFCVNDPYKWHSANLKQNPSHYSGIKYFGGSAIARYQHEFGARVYFNTLVKLDNGQQVKYGVISKQHLIDDLTNWTYLYVAGRLQKPIEILYKPDATIIAAINQNLKSAVHVSLLLLPENFTYYDLFYTIANLSYAGDFRMIFGEKKDKVKNIVAPQIDEFLKLYLPTLQSLSQECLKLPTSSDQSISQNLSTEIIKYHLEQCPRELIIRLNKCTELDKNPPKQLRNVIQKNVNSIVWNSSVTQSLKNIPTAGLSKAVAYSWKKILKTLNVM